MEASTKNQEEPQWVCQACNRPTGPRFLYKGLCIFCWDALSPAEKKERLGEKEPL